MTEVPSLSSLATRREREEQANLHAPLHACTKGHMHCGSTSAWAHAQSRVYHGSTSAHMHVQTEPRVSMAVVALVPAHMLKWATRACTMSVAAIAPACIGKRGR